MLSQPGYSLANRINQLFQNTPQTILQQSVSLEEQGKLLKKMRSSSDDLCTGVRIHGISFDKSNWQPHKVVSMSFRRNRRAQAYCLLKLKSTGWKRLSRSS